MSMIKSRRLRSFKSYLNWKQNQVGHLAVKIEPVNTPTKNWYSSTFGDNEKAATDDGDLPIAVESVRGSFIDKEGKDHDIRDINYLAVVNMTQAAQVPQEAVRSSCILPVMLHRSVRFIG